MKLYNFMIKTKKNFAFNTKSFLQNKNDNNNNSNICLLVSRLVPWTFLWYLYLMEYEMFTTFWFTATCKYIRNSQVPKTIKEQNILMANK